MSLLIYYIYIYIYISWTGTVDCVVSTMEVHLHTHIYIYINIYISRGYSDKLTFWSQIDDILTIVSHSHWNWIKFH